MVAHGSPESIINEEKGYGGYRHGIKHPSGCGGTNEDAIVQEGSKAGQWNGEYPIEIGRRCCDDTLFILFYFTLKPRVLEINLIFI